VSVQLPALVRGERKAPVPVGPLTGRRRALRRLFAYATAAMNRLLDRLPVGRFLHRRVQRGLCFTPLELPLRAGAENLHGLRIAFLSDLHAGSFMDARDLAALCARVQQLQPHLVLFGGDLINTRERELLLYRDALALLQPPLGVFAVPGNHDLFWGPDIGLWTSFLQEHGVQVLRNRGVRLSWNGQSLWLCGVDDLTEGRPDLQQALDGRYAGEPTILLSHHPDFFFEAAAADVDLTLAGHTHGGQIRLFGRAPVHHSQFGYEQGWFAEGSSRLYVGRGVGVTVLPLRIGAPPELPIVTLVARTAVAPEPAREAAAAAPVAGVGPRVR
jgi:predicted MPP superfamily phosphohydrolase